MHGAVHCRLEALPWCSVEADALFSRAFPRDVAVALRVDILSDYFYLFNYFVLFILYFILFYFFIAMVFHLIPE